MKVLTVEPGPAFSVADVHNGWRRAFGQLGCEVANVNLGDRIDFYSNARMMKGRKYIKAFSDMEALQMAAKGLEVACYEFWPDIVFITSCFFIPDFTMQMLRRRGHKVVILHTESPYEDDGQLTRAQHADFNLINDPTNIDRFRDVAPTEYQWHCYDPAIHSPRAPRKRYASDFCFVGTGYPSRVDFFESIDWSGINATFGGNWTRLEASSSLRPFVAHNIKHCLDNDKAIDLYCSAKMSANVYRREAERPEHSTGWACGPREIELAACGVPFLTEKRGENAELFPFMPTFDGPLDFEEKLRWWLGHEDERADAAALGRAAVAQRTFENSARRLLGRLS